MQYSGATVFQQVETAQLPRPFGALVTTDDLDAVVIGVYAHKGRAFSVCDPCGPNGAIWESYADVHKLRAALSQATSFGRMEPCQVQLMIVMFNELPPGL